MNHTKAIIDFSGYSGAGLVPLAQNTLGALAWIRVHTVGLKGVMGAWSDPAQIRVL